MRAAWVEIDVAAYRRNLRGLAEHTGSGVLAVVKANGYGHGMVRMAAEAFAADCVGVGVALPEEGAELRAAGQAGRILVMGLALEEHAGLIVEHDLDAVVTRPEVLDALAAAAEGASKRAQVHVKVDTGMTRVGVLPGQALAFCSGVAENQRLRLAGLMTHFASSETEDQASMRAQWERFAPLAEEVRGWISRPVVHTANSGASLWFRPSWLGWIRPGLVTYGIPPAPRPLPIAIEPVASLKAKIVQVREVPAGVSVSYGGTWTAPRPSRLALVPLGYGDGYPWSLSNQGEALLRGRRVPIRGRVCMDQMVLDATDLPPVEPGEEVVFVGRQGEEELTVSELAERAGTIPYEILTRFAARLPRIYLDSP